MGVLGGPARARFGLGSIRLRLTAWYTLLLAAVLVAVGVALTTLLERQLRADVDDRLLSTAEEVIDDATFVGPRTLRLPPLDPFASSGLFVQLVNAENHVAGTSNSLGDRALPAAPVSPDNPVVLYRTVDVDGQAVRTVQRQVITRDGRYFGAIVVGESLASVERTLDRLRRLLLVAAGIGLPLAALGGWLLAGRALRPVDRITATAADVAAAAGSPDALATRLEVPATGDELARLAATFNLMLDRLETAFRAQRRFVADASHELRTPLAAIRGNLDVLVRRAAAGAPPGQDDLDALTDLQRESARMGRLLDDLLALARAEAPARGPSPRAPVRLDLVAAEALRTAQPLADRHTLDLAVAAEPVVAGDPDRLHQLLLLLIENALRHTPAGGTVTVDVGTVGDQAQVQVRDTGPGIAPEHLPHLFEPFYRVDTARDRATGGTGLGLAIARSITTAHDGAIGVASTPGDGSTFTVRLPLLRRPPHPPPAAE